jgi:DNA-binding PadR family transcriptional regulator
MLWSKGRHLGEFEELLLLCVESLGDAAYAVRIRERFHEDTSRRVTLGAVYAALDRMERKRYVQCTVGDPTPERGGRRKRFYRVTKRGRGALRTAQASRSRLWQRVEASLAGANT